MRLSVVVLSFNRIAELTRTIEMLRSLRGDVADEIVIVDNGSTDGSRELLAELRPSEFRVVALKENSGVAGGRACGWEVTSGEFILSLDEDVHVDAAQVRLLLAHMDKFSNCGLAFPPVVNGFTGEIECSYGSGIYSPANYHGCCHLVRRQAYVAAGPMDLECDFGGEELEYSIRLRKAGFDVSYVPIKPAIHNRINRRGKTARWRVNRWITNYTRVIFKNFELRRAVLWAVRYCISQAISQVRLGNVTVLPGLFISAIKGARRGLDQYSPVGGEIMRLYSDPTLRPDFGNVTLGSKLRNALIRALARS